MTWLDKQWQQHALEAMLQTFDAAPHLKRQMVEFLLDEGFWDRSRLSWDAAIARFNACLNPNKAEFFKISEAWALMKRFQLHELALAMIEDLGYERPRLRPTEERRQALMQQMVQAIENSNQVVAAAQAELARLRGEGSGDPVRLHPTIAEGKHPAFSLSDDATQTGPGTF